MKKHQIFLAIILFLVANVNGKTVKISVDMTDIFISPSGPFVAGDFQTLAGYSGGDWQSNTTALTQEGNSNIYFVVVNIPAFAKYEYKFLSGDQWYESEFVPLESRVENPFNDNRWIYIDSLDSDTFFVPTIQFGKNAPAGKLLVRFKVDLSMVSVSSNGIHLAGDFQNWNPQLIRLYNLLGGDLFEYHGYFDSLDIIDYNFYNGNQSNTVEQLVGNCASNSKRTLQITKDTVLESVCFGYCMPCNEVGFVENSAKNNELKLWPNPSSEYFYFDMNTNEEAFSVLVFDLNGKKVLDGENLSSQSKIDCSHLTPGLYLVQVVGQNQIFTDKIFIQ